MNTGQAIELGQGLDFRFIIRRTQNDEYRSLDIQLYYLTLSNLFLYNQSSNFTVFKFSPLPKTKHSSVIFRG